MYYYNTQPTAEAACENIAQISKYTTYRVLVCVTHD